MISIIIRAIKLLINNFKHALLFLSNNSSSTLLSHFEIEIENEAILNRFYLNVYSQNHNELFVGWRLILDARFYAHKHLEKNA